MTTPTESGRAALMEMLRCELRLPVAQGLKVMALADAYAKARALEAHDEVCTRCNFRLPCDKLRAEGG